jgi:transcriptional regulator with XRE-family HTH domain
MDIFSLRLKELRVEKGFTQKELARVINTTDDSIYSWEKARSQPPLDTLVKLADFFECSVDYLLGREDDFGNIIVTTNTPSLSKEEQEIIATLRALPKEFQIRIESYVSTLGELAADEKKYKTQRK